MQGGRFEPVAEHGDEMLAGAEPERIESGDRAADALQPRGIGETPIPVHDRAGGGIAGRRSEKRPSEVRHRPVAPRSARTPPEIQAPAGSPRAADGGSSVPAAEVAAVAASSTAETMGS